MSNMTEMDLVALKSYASKLETFISHMRKYCEDLETGITSCSNYMQDANSQAALKKGMQVSADIRACLNPAQQDLELVFSMIHNMEAYQNDFTL